MKIFLTGASGFIGKNLVKALLLDNKISEIFCLYRVFPKKRYPKIKYIEGDLSILPALMLDAKIDVCVHLAGEFRSSNKKQLFNVNKLGMHAVCNFCKNNTINNVVYTSSINVNILGYYGESKLESEKILQASGLQYTIFRPSLVYGPNNSHGAIDKIAKFISIFHVMPIFGNGLALEQPIFIDDMVSYLHQALFMPYTQEVLTVGGPRPYSYNELVALIVKRINKSYIPLHISPYFIFKVLKCTEFCKIPLPLTTEQVQHQIENLDIKQDESLKKFDIQLTDFWEGTAYLSETKK